MLNKEMVAIFIAACSAQDNEYAHGTVELAKFPHPGEIQVTEEPEINLYCFSCGVYCATGRSGVRISRCPDCGVKRKEIFAHAYEIARTLPSLTYDNTTFHTLFNLFLHWVNTKPEQYEAFRAQVKKPRNDAFKELMS